VSGTSPVDTIEAHAGSTCATGGVATAQVHVDSSSTTQQDEISVASTAGELCSVQLTSCFTPTVPLNLPQGCSGRWVWAALDCELRRWICQHTEWGIQLDGGVELVHGDESDTVPA